MVSLVFESQRPVCWACVTWCFVLLAALCCCNGVSHQETVKAADQLRRASESSRMQDATEQPETAAVYLGDLLDAGDGAIVTLVTGDARLAAHKAVLAAGSPTFAAMFRPDTAEANTSEVNIPGLVGPVLRQLVAYLYTGRATKLPSMAPQLLAAAENYGVSALRDASEQQLLRHLDVESAAAAAVMAVKYSRYSLQKAAITFIKDHIFEVLATQGWAEGLLNHPREVVQIYRLLTVPPAETSTPAATDSTTTAPTASTATTRLQSNDSQTPVVAARPIARCCTPQPDEKAVTRFWSLSVEDRNRRLLEMAKEGAERGVMALLAAGADVDAVDPNGWTALHWAAAKGHVQVAQCLLQAGAGMEVRTTDWQSTPLSLATTKGQGEVARLLLRSSADIDARDVSGRTPLHWAAFWGDAETAAALLDAGADKAARDKHGQTPLDIARRHDEHHPIHDSMTLVV